MKNLQPIFSNDGYRPNIGIVIRNHQGKVFWARRVRRDGWQFPQGGMVENESIEQAMYRELREETGLNCEQVKIVGHTNGWIKYDLPAKLLKNQKNNPSMKNVQFKGQKQIWYLLELLEDDSAINLDSGEEPPEFDCWKWVDARFALDNIVSFKRNVYQQALDQLGKLLASPLL